MIVVYCIRYSYLHLFFLLKFHSSELNVNSHYILAVWGFLCLKWSYYLFQQSRHYTTSYHPDSEDAAPFVIQEVLPQEEEIS